MCLFSIIKPRDSIVKRVLNQPIYFLLFPSSFSRGITDLWTIPNLFAKKHLNPLTIQNRPFFGTLASFNKVKPNQAELEYKTSMVKQFSRVPDHLSKPRSKWSSELDNKLLEVAQQKMTKTWKMLAKEYFPEFTWKQLHGRHRILHQPPSLKGKWHNEEIDLLKKAVLQFGSDWSAVSKRVGSRAPLQCVVKWNSLIDPEIGRDPWTDKESYKLMEFVLKCPGFRMEEGSPDYSNLDWKHISKSFAGKTLYQCRMHFFSLLCCSAQKRLNLPAFDNGVWTPQQKKKLIGMVEKYPGNWALISCKMRSRSPNQCRNQWGVLKRKKKQIDSNTFSYAKIKYFTPFEDETLLRMYRLLGSRWTLIQKSNPVFAVRSSQIIRARLNYLLNKLKVPWFTLLAS